MGLGLQADPVWAKEEGLRAGQHRSNGLREASKHRRENCLAVIRHGFRHSLGGLVRRANGSWETRTPNPRIMMRPAAGTIYWNIQY
jgi:hypothetical protein